MVENLTNHVTLLLDASSSMTKLKNELIKVADAQIGYLAERSKVHKQETRISVYAFADGLKNLIWDMDVLRLPSIAQLYNPYGWTALRDAVAEAIQDYREIPQKHGDHAFLTYVLTDGAENRSRHVSTAALNALLTTLRDNETVAALVPDHNGVLEAKRFGFPAANVALWNPDADKGISEAIDTISRTTDNWMQGRSRGVRSSRDIFSMGTDALNKQTVTSALTPLSGSSYMLLNVLPRYDRWEVKPFIADHGLPFTVGQAFYQLSKREEIQPDKQIAVFEKKTKKVYSGPQARQVVGLPDVATRVSPQDNPDYVVFVQSKAPNRKVDSGTKLLYLK